MNKFKSNKVVAKAKENNTSAQIFLVMFWGLNLAIITLFLLA